MRLRSHLASGDVPSRQVAMYDRQVAMYDQQVAMYDRQVAMYDRQVAMYDRQVAMYKSLYETLRRSYFPGERFCAGVLTS